MISIISYTFRHPSAEQNKGTQVQHTNPGIDRDCAT